MKNTEIISNFEGGKLFTLSNIKSFSNLEWIPHKEFSGVALKNLLTSSDTDNEISYHLVKIDPGCEIGIHIHKDSTEIHEVICGIGVLTIDDKEQRYFPGNISVIPKKAEHKVRAGNDGLYLLAKFIPALV